MMKNPIVMARTSLHHIMQHPSVVTDAEETGKRKTLYGLGEKVNIEYEAQDKIWEVSGYITKVAYSSSVDEIVYEINDSITRKESEIISSSTYDKRKL